MNAEEQQAHDVNNFFVLIFRFSHIYSVLSGLCYFVVRVVAPEISMVVLGVFLFFFTAFVLRLGYIVNKMFDGWAEGFYRL